MSTKDTKQGQSDLEKSLHFESGFKELCLFFGFVRVCVHTHPPYCVDSKSAELVDSCAGLTQTTPPVLSEGLEVHCRSACSALWD